MKNKIIYNFLFVFLLQITWLNGDEPSAIVECCSKVLSTSEENISIERFNGLGPTADSNGNGFMFHSCLVAKYHESEETEILGLGYQEAWVRPVQKSRNEPKESEVWLRTLKKMGVLKRTG